MKLFMALKWFWIFFSYSSQYIHANQCKQEFFTVLADKMPWKSNSNDCITSFMSAKDRILLLSVSLHQMNSTLTIYTSFDNIDTCRSLYGFKNVYITTFNAKELLFEYKYPQDVLKVMNNWNLLGYARSSDIIRLMLAHKYNQIYVDTDVHFLDHNISAYTIPYVAVNVWQDIENALEISNCAFCLPSSTLLTMIQFQQNRILKGPEAYQYTELGPSMFHKVLMNQPNTVALYSQNHPKETNFIKIAESVVLYHHKFLHVTTAIRKSHPSLHIIEIVNKIRKELNLPLIQRHSNHATKRSMNILNS